MINVKTKSIKVELNYSRLTAVLNKAENIKKLESLKLYRAWTFEIDNRLVHIVKDDDETTFNASINISIYRITVYINDTLKASFIGKLNKNKLKNGLPSIELKLKDVWFQDTIIV